MSAELRIIQAHWDELTSHLLADGDEHAALLFCGWSLGTARPALLTRRVQILGPEDFLHEGALHLSIAPTTLARATKLAAADSATLVLCHSHPWPGTTRPSALDLKTEADFCGRVLPGRLKNAPSGGLVLGVDDVSARLWHAGVPEPLKVRIIGDETRYWPEPADAPSPASVARQVLAWGGLGQSRLQRSSVAVVGAGGTGTHVATQLAHLGVGRIVLIDHDTVEATNLSRLVGARPSDVGRLKVDVLAEALRDINPDVSVATHPESVLDLDPADLVDADVIVCATDGHGSRALLTELSQQYLVPVVDLGVEIVPTAAGVQAGGQVRVLRPGRGCLHCVGTLDAALVREEYMSEAEREVERTRGYLRGIEAPAPAVISLNGVVASLAVLEVCQLLAGFLGSSNDRILLRAHRRAVTTASVNRAEDCFVCGSDGILGTGDSRPLPSRNIPRKVRGAG
jgi:molybdopterin/thiamine biosynthesis adenylyltransferase